MGLGPRDSTLSEESAAAIAAVIAEADAAWSVGARSRAMSLLTALSERAPNSATVWSRLGSFALEAGRADAAHFYLRSALGLAPEDSSAWTNLGIALIRL